MAVKTWTEDQKQAISARDSSLLVAAAAGSGKTAVLVERIVQRVLNTQEGIDIDRLMVVTFTDAAASELRERIGKRIADSMENVSSQEEFATRKRIKRQLTLLNKATISTMHGFCAKLLRKHFNKIELEPNFRILDGIEAKLLQEEMVDLLLEEQYEGTRKISAVSLEEFEVLVDIYGGRKGDESLKDLVLRVYEKTNANPFPKHWRDTYTEAFSPHALLECKSDFCNTLWGDLLTRQLKREVPEWIQSCEYAISLCEEGGNPAYVPAFQYHLQYFQTISHAMECGWDAIQKAVSLYSFDRFPSKTKGCDEVALQKVKNIAENMKKAIEEYGEKFFANDTAANLEQLSQSYTVIRSLCALVDEFEKLYGEKKRQKGVVDYNDLEHFALKLLVEHPEVAKELQAFYEEVYIDEYQDTNMTQETILSLVTKQPPEKNNLFMVGDVKQSIYGFRQARPDIFLGKYNRFSKEAQAEQRLILLSKNFRSRKDVIGCVNYVFAKMMTKEVCGMDYTKDAYLSYGADYADAVYDVSCELLVADIKEEIAEEDIEQSNLEIEAGMIAKRIGELLEEARGALTYKDIVILLRATKEKAEVYREVLAQQGIPAFCDVNAGCYQSQEGKIILSLLQIVDNPLQDIPFLAVLKSSIGGFTEEEIATIRLQDRNRYFYCNVKEAAKAGNEKASAFLSKLTALREYATEHDLSELILEIYHTTDYYNYAGVFADGRQRQANLQKIYEEAVSYETQTGGGIFSFLAHADRIRDNEGDMGGAMVLGENDNVIRIMSIHKSKGLEFPVVFLANMHKTFNRKDSAESILLHQDLGFGLEGYDRTYRVKYDTISKIAMKWKQNQELVAEEIRLLYVAVTRAKEKLILCGMVSDLEKTFQRQWDVLADKDAFLPAGYALKAKSYFDFVLPILLRHPDLHGAREAAGIPNSTCTWRIPQGEELCQIQFRLFSKESLQKKRIPAKEKSSFISNHAEKNNEMEAEVMKRLSAGYPFAESTELPKKISVSQLNHKDTMPQILQQPHFLDGKRKRTAAEWGSITHYILQYISLDAISKETVQALCRKQGLTEEEVEQFAYSKILQFFESEIGKRMRQAKKVYREKPFTMEVPAKQLFADVSTVNEDTVLVQGIIDCYFEEEDGIVILDYKTDSILPGNAVLAAETYRKQLELYKRAIETETGKKVKETRICFLQTGETVVQ